SGSCSGAQQRPHTPDVTAEPSRRYRGAVYAFRVRPRVRRRDARDRQRADKGGVDPDPRVPLLEAPLVLVVPVGPSVLFAVFKGVWVCVCVCVYVYVYVYVCMCMCVCVCVYV